jgi:hypothetical protein
MLTTIPSTAEVKERVEVYIYSHSIPSWPALGSTYLCVVRIIGHWPSCALLVVQFLVCLLIWWKLRVIKDITWVRNSYSFFILIVLTHSDLYSYTNSVKELFNGTDFSETEDVNEYRHKND